MIYYHDLDYLPIYKYYDELSQISPEVNVETIGGILSQPTVNIKIKKITQLISSILCYNVLLYRIQ